MPAGVNRQSGPVLSRKHLNRAVRVGKPFSIYQGIIAVLYGIGREWDHQ